MSIEGMDDNTVAALLELAFIDLDSGPDLALRMYYRYKARNALDRMAYQVMHTQYSERCRQDDTLPLLPPPSEWTV